MSRPRSAVVLGATGHLGQAVTRELLSRGWEVSAATRQASPRSLAGLDVRVLPGDADSPGQLERWVAGHELVIDAAAPHPLGTYPRLAARSHDPIAHARRRTAALLDAAAAHGARLALISSFTTLPRPDEGLRAVEAQWRRQAYPYFAVKEEIETMVLEAARNGLPAVVVNPTACLGPWEHRGASSSLVGLVVSQRLPLVLHHVLNVIDVRDVASALLAAVDADLHGVPIGLCGHDIALDELARRLERARRRASTDASRASPHGAVRVLGRVRARTGRAGRAGRPARRPAHRRRPVHEPGREQLALGVAIRPLDDTLRDAVQWHRSLG